MIILQQGNLIRILVVYLTLPVLIKFLLGLITEMEVVPSFHPNVTCDGCGMNPVSGIHCSYR